MKEPCGTLTFIPQDYEVFAGLDVDKTSISITFLSHHGFIKSLRIPACAKQLLHYVRKQFAGRQLAFVYEAGPTGYTLYDELTAHGYPCLVVAPSMVPTAPGQRVKTNRLDSQKLAENLRGGQLHSIHVPSTAYRHLRHLTHVRDTWVRQVAATKCRIKGLLLYEGIPFPPAPRGTQWSCAVLAQLQTLPCSPVVRFTLDQLLDSLLIAKQQVRATMQEIRRFCRQDPELHRGLQYVMSIPGIGWIVASQVLARVGDWQHLEPGGQLSAFLGVVPREHSTGDRIQRGRITRVGDRRLRSKLIQGAWAAIRQDAELHAFYQRVAQRHPRPIGARKAIVAVARKLSLRMAAVLHEQRPYVMRRTCPVV